LRFFRTNRFLFCYTFIFTPLFFNQCWFIRHHQRHSFDPETNQLVNDTKLCEKEKKKNRKTPKTKKNQKVQIKKKQFQVFYRSIFSGGPLFVLKKNGDNAAKKNF